MQLLSSEWEEMIAEEKLSILVIEPDQATAELVIEALNQEVPFAELRHAASLAEAVRILDDSWADLALVAHELPDGTSLDLLARAREGMVPVPVIVHLPDIDPELQLACEREGAACSICGPVQPGATVYPVRMLASLARQLGRVRRHLQESRMEQLKTYDSIRTTLSRVSHQISNPLSIVFGNAQLLLELTRALDLEDEFLKPVEDIIEASERVASLLRGLSEITEQIPKRPL